MNVHNLPSQKIGFIGQGWIGRNLADHFEERGFDIVRYAKEPEFAMNKEAIAGCDVVFIAVPTPSTPEGFDDRILAVIKSTILPGSTDIFAALYPDRFVMHSPEFLREASVRKDIDFPDRNIVGIPSPFIAHKEWIQKAEALMRILPDAPYQMICKASEAELTKYGSNNFLFVKVVFMNLMYDIATKHSAEWDTIAKNMTADPRIGTSHMQPIHQIAHMGSIAGRGAGGHCFIKDFAAFRQLFEQSLGHDKEAVALLRALESKGKDLDILDGIYGKVGKDIAGMEETLMKEGDDISAMEKALAQKDLPTLEAAYMRAGKDLADLEQEYKDAGGDISALEALSPWQR
jgi:UDP-glucose/GDP-mannose dehydrogenase family, central domain/UDP-glucose/GDP-mannose dehydrogenase family, NAD binding domain